MVRTQTLNQHSNDVFQRMLDISDSAYFSADSYDHMVVTTWIPFLDTNAGNGGMQV